MKALQRNLALALAVSMISNITAPAFVLAADTIDVEPLPPVSSTVEQAKNSSSAPNPAQDPLAPVINSCSTYANLPSDIRHKMLIGLEVQKPLQWRTKSIGNETGVGAVLGGAALGLLAGPVGLLFGLLAGGIMGYSIGSDRDHPKLEAEYSNTKQAIDCLSLMEPKEAVAPVVAVSRDPAVSDMTGPKATVSIAATSDSVPRGYNHYSGKGASLRFN